VQKSDFLLPFFHKTYVVYVVDVSEYMLFNKISICKIILIFGHLIY